MSHILKGFEINEKWHVMGEIENYSRTVKDEEAVAEYIIDWIEGWLTSACENEYTITKVVTDFKTYAKVRMMTDIGCDKMNLSVAKL